MEIRTSVEGKRGCDSNGAGKSFLFDGAAWALFGRCIREKYKGDDVVRLGSKGSCSVEVHIVGGPHKIRIVRYRKHPVHVNHVYLYVDDKNKSRGTDPATTIAIEKLAGIQSPLVKEIRGRGLWIGIELTTKARPLCEKLMEEGLLCKETHDHVIRLAPPLVIQKEEIDWAYDRLKRVIEAG